MQDQKVHIWTKISISCLEQEIRFFSHIVQLLPSLADPCVYFSYDNHLIITIIIDDIGLLFDQWQHLLISLPIEVCLATHTKHG